MIRAVTYRFSLALRWPCSADWRAMAPIALGGLVAITALSFALGLARLDPLRLGWIWLRYAGTFLIIPALGEEALFRGLLVTPRGEPMSPGAGLAAVAAFVLWHPLQAITFGPPWAASFLNPAFLVVVAVLGTMLVWMYRRSGSIWPGVFLHWLVVAGWKLLFGGPIG